MSTYPSTASLPQTASVNHRWLLDEASGNRADAVGSLTLTDGNTVTAGTGYSDLGATFNNSAYFNSTNSEYLRNTGAGSSVTGNQDFSLTTLVQFKAQPATNSQMQIVNMYGTADAEREWSFHYRDTGGTKYLRFDNNNGSTNVTVAVTQSLTTDTWYLLGISFDLSAGSVAFYLDGSQTGSTQTGLNTTVNQGTGDFTLGAIGDTPSQFANMWMNDTIFYAGAVLSSTDHSDLYTLYTTAAAGAVVPTPQLTLLGVG